jgi:hypothetical protein
MGRIYQRRLLVARLSEFCILHKGDRNINIYRQIPKPKGRNLAFSASIYVGKNLPQCQIDHSI